jgi:hypothetical protein
MIRHPFKASADDHCESPPEAYRDIAPLLDMLAASLGKKRAELKIYDPYYCAGACPKHLGALGFADVYNKCEDFYATADQGGCPEHDVVVTNPPYSGTHVERLLGWIRKNGKPFLLLMPNYFAAKPYVNGFALRYISLHRLQTSLLQCCFILRLHAYMWGLHMCFHLGVPG